MSVRCAAINYINTYDANGALPIARVGGSTNQAKDGQKGHLPKTKLVQYSENTCYKINYFSIISQNRNRRELKPI